MIMEKKVKDMISVIAVFYNTNGSIADDVE